MLTPASAHAYAGGTAPGNLPGTAPPAEQASNLPAGPGTETQYNPGPAVVIGLSEEVKGQLDRWFGPEPEDDDGILPEEVMEAAEDPFREPEGSTGDAQVSAEEQQVVSEMSARDAEVRAHENAHVAAGGGLTGAVSYSYQVGPDGKRYAVGGSVKIDMSRERTPELTLKKAERIRAAALAPAEPSPQDVAVASKAGEMASEARAEIAQNKRIEAESRLEDAKEGMKSPWSQATQAGENKPEPGQTMSTTA